MGRTYYHITLCIRANDHKEAEKILEAIADQDHALALRVELCPLAYEILENKELTPH